MKVSVQGWQSSLPWNRSPSGPLPSEPLRKAVRQHLHAQVEERGCRAAKAFYEPGRVGVGDDSGSARGRRVEALRGLLGMARKALANFEAAGQALAIDPIRSRT